MNRERPLRDLETASPPAAMTSQNYLQLLHEKSDSFPSNLASYANMTSNSIHSDPVLPTSNINSLPYLNKEETYQDLPTLPQKLVIRSKTDNNDIGGRTKNKSLVLNGNNNFEISSEPHMNSDTIDGKRNIDVLNLYKTECIDSRRSS